MQKVIKMRGQFVNIFRLASIACVLSLATTTATLGATLDRIKEAGKITLGFEPDARPFSFAGDGGKPSGYSVALCEKVVQQVKKEVGNPDLKVEWVAVKLDDRLRAMQEKQVDVLCGADSVTLARRAAVGFSLPIFSSGIGALVRADSPAALQSILTYGRPPTQPIWRGYPARTLISEKTFAVVAGTRSEKWLQERQNVFQITVKVVPVASYDEGIGKVIDRSVDVFFADLPILLSAVLRHASSADLNVIDRRFTSEPIALAIERGDEDFRLTVDRALSEFFGTDEFRQLLKTWFGRFSTNVEAFVDATVLPQ